MLMVKAMTKDGRHVLFLKLSQIGRIRLLRGSVMLIFLLVLGCLLIDSGGGGE
jgi:hypothetical protein